LSEELFTLGMADDDRERPGAEAGQATWAVPDPEPESQPARSSAQPVAKPETSVFGAILERLAERHDLNRSEAATALERIVAGEVSEMESAAFLMGLRVKGETADEIAGLLETMRRMAVPVETPYAGSLVDVVGTGGDNLGTFNISTTSAFVVAAAGVKVAKHGNRAASSRCGSADLLEAVGVRIDLSPAEVATCLDEVGMGFMLAPLHHPAMEKVALVRRTLGVRTVFNLLGPLTNPAGVQRQLVGVSSMEHMEVLAGALARVGCRHALLVRGDDGMDELSVCAQSTVAEVEQGVVQPPYSLSPEECGVCRWALAGLQGGGPDENAFITKGVLKGTRKGAPRDAVALNAGAALYVAGAVSSIQDGVGLAITIIDEGKAAEVLENLVAVTHRLVEARA
jgi:anthranilate phosphoribosyltransferase